MLSRKNYNEKLRQMSNQKDRFSIRKLTVGAASVLIGITFMGFSGQKVNADEITSTQPAVEQVTKTDTAQQDNSADNVQKASDTTQKVEATQSDAQISTQAENKETTQQDKSVDANADNSKAETENKTAETPNSDTKTSEVKTDTQTQDKQQEQVPATTKATDTTQKKDEQANQTQDLTVKSTDDKAQATANETTDKAQQSAAKALAQSKVQLRINPESEGQFNVDDWDGSLDNATHEYTLTSYHGTDKENIYIPNTQDFIDAGRISSNDKVYITRDLMHNITVNGAVNVTVDDQGEKNKVYAKGDWSEAFGAYGTHLKSVDLSHVDTSGITNMFYLFLGSGDLKSVNFSGCDLSNVTNSTYMFAWAGGDMNDVNITGTKGVPKELLDKYMEVFKKTDNTTLDLSNITISSHATNLSNLFADMPNVTSIDLTGWDTSNVTNMSFMFSDDPNLTMIKGIENWNTSKVTNMSFMFAGYHGNYWASPDSIGHLNKLDLTNWDTHSVKDMSFMFAGQSHLTSLGDLSHRGNKWNTGNVTNMAYMFYGLQSLPDGELKLNNWDTSNVTDMSYMFTYMTKQKHMDFLTNWNTSKVTDMCYMFDDDPELQSLDLSHWDVSSVGTKNNQQNYSFADMFYNDSSLTSVGDISHWNTENVHDTRGMFYNTQKLNDIDLSGWNTDKLQIAGEMFGFSGAKHINLDNWNFGAIKRFEDSGLVNDNGPLRGVANMFRCLQNKAVISMNNVILPDDRNAFEISDFIGDNYELADGNGDYEQFQAQPIVVIANGAAGNTLKALNNAQWTDLNGNTVIGRQNTNKLTYVRADDNTKQIGQHGLDFVFTSVADLQNYLNGVTKKDVVKNDIGSLSHDWDANQDTNSNVVKVALRLTPDSSYDPRNVQDEDAKGDTLADLVTSKYQLHIVDPTVTREVSDPTRTIIVDYPDGSTHREVQSVEFTRTVTKHIDNTEQVTPWTPASGNWNQYDVPQISGYDSYIDGVAGTVVNAKTVAPKGENATVHVTYVSNTPSNPGNNPTNPSNPGNTPDNPGNNPEQPTAPVAPSEPNVAPKPEAQPTTPANGNDNEKNNNQETVRPHAQNEATKKNGHSKKPNKTVAPSAEKTPHAAIVPNKLVAPKSDELPNDKGMQKLAAKPTSNAEANNKEKANTLPQTGEKKSNLGVIGLGLLVLAGLGIVDRKRRN